MTRSILGHRGAVWALGLLAGVMLSSGRLTSVLPQAARGMLAGDGDTAPPPPLAPEPKVVPGAAPLQLPPAPAPAQLPPLPAPAATPVPPASARGANPAELPDLPPPRTLTPAPPAPEPKRPASPTRAVARVEGTAAPGLQVILHGEGSKGSDLRYRWVQTRGPAVVLDDAGSSSPRFTAPAGVGPLGFLLVVAGSEGSDTAELTVPLEGLPRAQENTLIRADAGDDQLGLVGRQVTLNGMRSEPRGRIGYRWVQTGGPGVRFKIEDGYVFSFVPTVPGVYRFALVVASGSEISTPDEVSVTVGSSARAASRGAGVSSPPGAAEVDTEGPVPTQEVARSGLAAVHGGNDAAEPLARVFEETADRMALYPTYGDAFSEMSRRLETILPGEPVQRASWVDRLFNPLSARTLEVLRAEGLDLRLPEGQKSPLTASQKAALAEQFRLMAEGFRSASRPR